ncbi:hypothetical protein GTS_03580 [Gandjariella thermophila]|uniref:Uncharacterized protein n=1 Tax=Gandjariella thermophila TaxID=1931992 RepID=A0A4D4IWK4_9PSEU|nr:hypothetical protein GTS_03580 [Gandjariella thermophila]
MPSTADPGDAIAARVRRTGTEPAGNAGVPIEGHAGDSGDRTGTGYLPGSRSYVRIDGSVMAQLEVFGPTRRKP